MTRSKAAKIRRLIEAAMNLLGLDDSDALDLQTLFPNWSSDQSYITGQRVRYEGILYKCLSVHTAQNDWTPVAAPSLWARVLIEDPSIIPDWVQPGATNSYGIGDQVRHKDAVWESIIPFNVWEPGVYGWVTVDE